MSSKKTIPKPLKDLVWETYIGNDIATTKCLCCENNDIRMNNFHCAHILAEAKGGAMTVENLRPICSTCNLAMKTENMYEFKRRCGFMKTPPGLKTEGPIFKQEEIFPIPKSSLSKESMIWSPGISYKISPKIFKVPCEQLPVNGVMRDWPILSDLREMRVELYGKYREIDEYTFERV